MLQKTLLFLCLLPTLTFAESVCLEGPSGLGCHTVDMNGEVFKPNRTNIETRPSLGRNITSNLKTAPSNQVASTNNRRTFRLNAAEQRIRQKAQIIEARAQARRNLAGANSN